MGTSCDGQTEYTDCDLGRAYPPSKMRNLVEGYALHATPLTEVSRSLGWGGIRPDASDDDVAAVWAQHWARHGTCISTFQAACIAFFVMAVHQQQRLLSDRQNPLPNEPRQIRSEISIAGSQFLGIYKSKPAGPEENTVARKLSFFARRDRERAIHQERNFGGFHHEEL
ncbi:hypothetical protein FS749_009764 [Ceratobasidium sp. UAMH 11750]|nr:hypothetical protein FS749_009764 [Ceratobasidium sp. UAMH 11750]